MMVGPQAQSYPSLNPGQNNGQARQTNEAEQVATPPPPPPAPPPHPILLLPPLLLLLRLLLHHRDERGILLRASITVILLSFLGSIAVSKSNCHFESLYPSLKKVVAFLSLYPSLKKGIEV